MHSLKTARPLLTSVAYFVLFAIAVFSYVEIHLTSRKQADSLTFIPRIIGVQSFKGSFRRTCVISPTLGETPHLRDGQFCGGFIDPQSMNVTGYVQRNNQTVSSAKGYICPLGQICMVGLFYEKLNRWI